MAVDTRDKRASALVWSEPSGRVLPNPSGTIGAPARLQAAYAYAGIAADAPAAGGALLRHPGMSGGMRDLVGGLSA